MNKSKAIEATKAGAIAALVTAVLSLMVVTFSLLLNSDDNVLSYWNDPLHLFDVVLVLIMSYGIYRKSRTAAVLMLVYFLVSKIIITIETEAMSGLILAVVFLYFFARSVQGAFVFHRIEKEEGEIRKPISKWVFIVAAPVLIVLLSLIGLGLMSTVGVFPSTRVQAASEIFASDREILIDKGIVSEKEKLEYFYSFGITDILEGGNVLTDKFVTLYFTDENAELKIYQIPIYDIVGIEIQSDGGSFEPSVYRVKTADPDVWINLILSAENKGDKTFVSAVRSKIKQ